MRGGGRKRGKKKGKGKIRVEGNGDCNERAYRGGGERREAGWRDERRHAKYREIGYW